MTNLTKPTHEEIALRAHRLWKDHGSHHGNDQELWFEAERQLKAGAVAAADENHGHAPQVHANPQPANHNTHPLLETAAAHGQADRQKQAARAPQVPQHTGPTAKAPVSGKPIFPLQHST